MTPKEKAQELFDKYATYVVMWAGDANTPYQNCKQCALIAVDEVLHYSKAHGFIGLTEFYEEVKQEIEKL
jgi:hypothetical protein